MRTATVRMAGRIVPERFDVRYLYGSNTTLSAVNSMMDTCQKKVVCEWT